jgi:hypothetical protein
MLTNISIILIVQNLMICVKLIKTKIDIKSFKADSKLKDFCSANNLYPSEN